MFEFKHDLDKIITYLDGVVKSLGSAGVNSALDRMAAKLAERHRKAFDTGGHPGRPAWEQTHPWYADKMPGKPGRKPMVWTGAAQQSVQQMGKAQGGVAHIGAVDYIGVFQFGPFHGHVPMSGWGDDAIVLRDETNAPRMKPIHRMKREVFYVAESDWNPFMQSIAHQSKMDFEDVGTIGFRSF